VYKSVFKGYRLSLRSVCSRFTLHKIHEHCLSFMQKMQQTDCSNPVINKPSLRNPGTKKQNKRKRAPQTKRRGGEGKTNKKKTRKEGPKRPDSYIYIYVWLAWAQAWSPCHVHPVCVPSHRCVYNTKTALFTYKS
jgi:hypothetical protein